MMTKGFVKKLVKKHRLVSWHTEQYAVTIEKAGDLYLVTKGTDIQVFGGFNRAYKAIRVVLI